jgi:hypothetical protein
MRDDVYGISPVKEMRELNADEVHNVAGGILDNGVGPILNFKTFCNCGDCVTIPWFW